MIQIPLTDYDLQEKNLEIAEKFFDLDKTSILKSGLFGYITEMTSHIERDAIYHRNILYNEFFLNTMNFPKSIYNKAKEINHSIQNAIPAHMMTVLMIKKKDLIKKATFKENEEGRITQDKEFILNKNNVFYAEEFPFMLPQSVAIECIKNVDSEDSPNYIVNEFLNTNYTIEAQYIIDELYNTVSSYSSITSTYIKTWFDKINGEEYIALSIDLYQMEKSVFNFSVYSNDISENLFFNVKYTDQLVGFDVYYEYNGIIKKLPTIFNNYYTPEDITEYAFYNFSNENELQISFSSMPNSFRPAFNSKLFIDVYTSKGTVGNFTYTGDMSFSLKYIGNHNDLNKINSVSGDFFSYAKANTDSVGGKNIQDLKVIKTQIQDKLLMRDNIITELDINKYFQNLINNNSVYNSKLFFIKKRDDIIKREFSAFLLLKDSTGEIIPSNTVDLAIDISDIASKNNVIPNGSFIIYDINLHQYRLLNENEYIDSYLKNDKIFLYSNPFMINVKLDPYPRIHYCKTSVNLSVTPYISKNNTNINKNFIINNFILSRNSIINNGYEFSLILYSDLEKEDLAEHVIVRAIIFDDDIAVGYFDMSLDANSSNGYKYILNTNDTLNYDNKFNIQNSIKNVYTGDVIPNLYVSEKCKVKIGVLYNDTFNKDRYEEFAVMSNIDVYACTVIYTHENNIYFHKSMNNIMNSNLNINSSGMLFLKEVPVIGSHYFSTIDSYKELYLILNNYENIIINNINKLENNTSVNMKFYNSYGISKFNTIDSTNLTLNADIALYTTSSELLSKIKSYIVSFVENVNYDDGRFSISNLITGLETNFKEIKYIKFNYLNGTDIKNIERIAEYENMNLNNQIVYIPEFLNVMHKNKKSQITINFI